MSQRVDRYIEIEGLRLHIREWLLEDPAAGKPVFVLLHGLASNAATWDLVASELVSAGHHVLAIDQRGHGLSDKPQHGYDFASVAGDVRGLIETLGLRHVILAGQSWGGNVALEVAARFPGLAAGYIFVDGGFLDLRQRGDWQQIALELRPPDLVGTQLLAIRERIASMHPAWSSEALALTLQNFEVLPDGTVRPWLTIDRHMEILRALYDQDVASLYPGVQQPVLICAADDGSEWASRKKQQVAVAHTHLPDAAVRWFAGAAHDIHVDRPVELARVMLDFSAQLA